MQKPWVIWMRRGAQWGITGIGLWWFIQLDWYHPPLFYVLWPLAVLTGTFAPQSAAELTERTRRFLPLFHLALGLLIGVTLGAANWSVPHRWLWLQLWVAIAPVMLFHYTVRWLIPRAERRDEPKPRPGEAP